MAVLQGVGSWTWWYKFHSNLRYSVILYISPSGTEHQPPTSNRRLEAHRYGEVETLPVEEVLQLWSQLIQLGSASLCFCRTIKSYKSTFIPSRWHPLPPFCSLLVYRVPFSTHHLLWGELTLPRLSCSLTRAPDRQKVRNSWFCAYVKVKPCGFSSLLFEAGCPEGIQAPSSHPDTSCQLLWTLVGRLPQSTRTITK